MIENTMLMVQDRRSLCHVFLPSQLDFCLSSLFITPPQENPTLLQAPSFSTLLYYATSMAKRNINLLI